jgi:alpha-L-fucosidase
MTTNGVWGHCPGDEDWKTPRQIALQLAQCAAGGGNLLLNVGPDATGRWPEPARTLLGQVGEWLRVHGEAIYPVQRHTLPWLLHGPQTVDGHTLFVFCDRWQRSGELVIGGLTNKVKSAQLLGTGDPLPFEQQAQTNPVAGGRVVVRDVPIDRPDILPVLKLRLDGPPRTQLSDRLHQADIHPVLPT